MTTGSSAPGCGCCSSASPTSRGWRRPPTGPRRGTWRWRAGRAILDVKRPKLTGLQATREIKRQAPEVSVLILSMHDDERYLFEALKAGASGYVLTAQADNDLPAATAALRRGGC